MTEPADAAFSERTFAETLRLIEDLRDYISSGESRLQGQDVEPASRMRAARDMSRLTNRATAAMSILLLHKALEDGQAADINNIPERLEELQHGMTDLPPPDPLDMVPLPPPVASLVERAEALFSDVLRVSAAIRARVAS